MEIWAVWLIAGIVAVAALAFLRRQPGTKHPPHGGPGPTVEDALTGDADVDNDETPLPPPGSGGDTSPTGLERHVPGMLERERRTRRR
jgi:hypothetical protein